MTTSDAKHRFKAREGSSRQIECTSTRNDGRKDVASAVTPSIPSQLPDLATCRRTIGFIPIISQLASLFYLLHLDVPSARTLQHLFFQGVVDTFKYLALARRVPRFRSSPRRRPGPWMGLLARSREFSSAAGRSSRPLRLAELCLPGSHNSHAYACVPTFTGTDWVLCQRLSVRDQLEAGVRLLDLRLNGCGRWFGHGMVATTSVEEVARDLAAFVTDHPTEIVVVLVKENGPKHGRDDGKCPGAVLEDALRDACLKSQRGLGSAASNAGKQVAAERFKCTTNSDGADLPVLFLQGRTDWLLRQRTVLELTRDGSRGLIAIDNWSNWEGSWGYTKSSIPSLVVDRSREWARMKGARSGGAGGRMHHPSVLEFTLTVDYGPKSRTVALALTHTIESCADLLAEHEEKEILFTEEMLKSVSGVCFDYPTDAQISKVIEHNERVVSATF